ncbi:hypothetical protein Tco_0433157 [Tanacetum coccineum]
MQLAELMSLCTNLQEKVLDLEKAKTTQAKEITSLKKRVKVESSNDASLGAQEDASKHGRKIKDLDADAEVTLFEKVVEEPVVSVATTIKSILVSPAEIVTTASASVVILDELTLAQTLIEIKTAKPKPVTNIATTVTSLQAELIEEERLARKKEEEANIALIESWDNTQAMMEAYFELA